MSENGSFIKLYRKTLLNPVVMKDTDHLALWMYLLMNAVAFPKEVRFGKGYITLQPGQLTTGRKKLAKDLKGCNESKIYRVLKEFESEQLIEQRTDRQCSLITIVNWDKYQPSEQRFEQQMNNDRTTSEQRVNTKRESKKEDKEENDYYSLPLEERLRKAGVIE